MSTANFVVETLVFPGVFPRGHPRVTLSPNDRLDIVVNKYSPKSNPNPKTGDVTLILLHANGFHKVRLLLHKTKCRNCMNRSLMPCWNAVSERDFGFARYGHRISRTKVPREY